MNADQNPIGLVIHGLGMGETERNTVVAHCMAANYSTVSVIDNFFLCQQLKDALPKCVVIHRDSRFEPSPSKLNGAVISNYLLDLPLDKRIVIMVNCEQGWNLERVNMWCDMILAAEALGWHLCVGNTSSGSIKCGQGDDPNDWLTTGARLLQTLAGYPGSYYGAHNYTSGFPWVVSNGVWGDPNKSPVINWNRPQWHLGREIQGIQAACKALGINMPYIVITEGLLDQMKDLFDNKDFPYRTIDSNRWRSLIPFWQKVYPGRSPESILLWMYQWAWVNIYSACDKVIGVHAFTWLSQTLSHNEWEGDNLANAPEYRAGMEKWRPALPVPPAPTPTPPPAPPLPGKPELELRHLRDQVFNAYTQVLGVLKTLDRMLE